MMDDKKFSCIKEITQTVLIVLGTSCLSTDIKSISDELESWKLRFIKQLKAVVVNYKNVSIISAASFIRGQYPCVHYKIKATFELFYPTVGTIVKGKINRISHDYIGCLINNTINVTINQPNDLTNVSNFIDLDRFILFEITEIYYRRKIIHVRGKITQECVRLMVECGLCNSEINDVDRDLVLTSFDSNKGVISHHKKLKRKRNELDSNLISEGISTDSGQYLCKRSDSVSEEMSTDSSLRSPKKKKLKKSHSTSEVSTDFEDNSPKIEMAKRIYSTSSVSSLSSDVENSPLTSYENKIGLMEPPKSKKKKPKKSHRISEVSTDSGHHSPEKEMSKSASSESSFNSHVQNSSLLTSDENKIELMQSPKSKKKVSKDDFKSVNSPVFTKEEINLNLPSAVTNSEESCDNFKDFLEMMETLNESKADKSHTRKKGGKKDSKKDKKSSKKDKKGSKKDKKGSKKDKKHSSKSKKDSSKSKKDSRKSKKDSGKSKKDSGKSKKDSKKDKKDRKKSKDKVISIKKKHLGIK